MPATAERDEHPDAGNKKGRPEGRPAGHHPAAHLMAIGAPVEPVAPAIGTGL